MKHILTLLASRHPIINDQKMYAVIRTVLVALCINVAWTTNAQDLLPETQVKTLDGKQVLINDMVEEGQLTVISFWATWCKPCKKELDAITELYEDWQEDYNMKLIAISVDNARAVAKVRPMVAEKQWPFEVLLDTNQDLMRALHFQSVPHTVLLNQQGEIVYTHSGYLPGDEDTLEEELQALMP